MKVGKSNRSLGFAGFLFGGIAGLLFTLFPEIFPGHTRLHGIMLIGSFLGAACQRLARPFLFYLSVTQVLFLRPLIGQRTQSEIIQKLTIRHFLGEDHDLTQRP
jgi:hypothetical protein